MFTVEQIHFILSHNGEEQSSFSSGRKLLLKFRLKKVYGDLIPSSLIYQWHGVFQVETDLKMNNLEASESETTQVTGVASGNIKWKHSNRNIAAKSVKV